MMWVQLGFCPAPSQRMAITESRGMETDPTPRLSAKKPAMAAAIPGNSPQRGPGRGHGGLCAAAGEEEDTASQSSFR